jgi:hypothetical protein
LTTPTLFAAFVSAGFWHNSRGFKNWKAAAEKWACSKLEKLAEDVVRAVGPIDVGGKSYDAHLITDPELVRAVDNRCSGER